MRTLAKAFEVAVIAVLVAVVLCSISRLSERLDSAERRLAEQDRVSHERRAILADELRKETDAKVAKVSAEVVRQAGLRGQQITAERAARSRDIGEAAQQVLDVTSMLLEERFLAIVDRLARIEARIGRLEARKPEVVREVKVVEQPIYLLPPPVQLIPVVPMPGRCR